MSGGIYLIRNTINGKLYVGSSANIVNRWAVHRHGLERGIHHSAKLQRAWSKYGASAFEWMVIERCEADALIAREQHWIDALAASTSAGYNICRVAGSSAGRVFSPETLEKMRQAKLGKKRSPESRLKQSEAIRGRPKSTEHRQKIGASQKGRECPAACRAGVAKANRARQHSQATREKLSAAAKRKHAARAVPEPAMESA